jgi:putative transposase
VASLDELNDRFWAWTERYLNVRRHSQTGESPLERYARGNLREADPERLRHAFLWSEQRKVSRTATVSFQGNDYQTDHALRGRRVELRFRPEDLERIEVWFEGRSFGLLTPLHIDRHVHPQALPPPRPLVEPTGVDYLGQVLADHEAEETGSISFRQLFIEEDES